MSQPPSEARIHFAENMIVLKLW